MRTRSEILKLLAQNRARIESFGVRNLALFGSAASGDNRPGSDIDLLVEFEPGVEVGFLTLARLQRELSALLGCRVDVVPKGGLKPLIRDSVLSSAVTVYAA